MNIVANQTHRWAGLPGQKQRSKEKKILLD